MNPSACFNFFFFFFLLSFTTPRIALESCYDRRQKMREREEEEDH